MPIKVRCPACNKSVRIDDGDAGRSAICAACGTRFDVPAASLLAWVEAPLSSPPPSAPTEISTDSEALVPIALNVPDEDSIVPLLIPASPAPLDASAPRVSPSHAAIASANGVTFSGLAPLALPALRAEEVHAVVRELQRRRPLHPLWWMAAMAAGVAILLGCLYGAGLFDTWEQEHHRQLVDLKSQAESLAAAGRLTQAHEKYAQLLSEADGHSIRDPALQAAIDQAREDQRRVYAILLQDLAARQRAQAAPAPAPPPAETVISTIAPLPAEHPEPDAGKTTQTPAPRLATPPPLAPVVAPEPVRSSRPMPQAMPLPRGELTDEQVGTAIQKGVDRLLAQFDPRTHVLREKDNGDHARFAGKDALAVYALLQSGQAINDPRLNVRGHEMAQMVDALKQLPMDGYAQTYARGIRATCLALFNRPEDFTTLADDADYLLGTCNDGAYTYNSERVPRGRRSFGPVRGEGWDNSNSQYGLLGVWSAVEAEPRIEVPTAYWRAIERHWNECQLGDGQWGYAGGGGSGRLTMTCAGIASLFVAHEYLDPGIRSAESVGREPFTPQLKKALNWFEQGDRSVRLTGYWGYCLYGIERVGLASGFKQFGTHDWYRELAAQVIRKERGWGDTVDTSYALLFLSRGRHPILMNKLRFDRRGDTQTAKESGAYWDNRPRDVANLARYVGRQLERPINWQIVSIQNPWTDWLDSPILYIASHVPPKFTDEDYDKLRNYVQAGGMIFTHADAASASFNAWAVDLAHRLFPQYEMADLPAESLVYNVVVKPTPRPLLRGVSNGARLLMVHAPGLPSSVTHQDDLASHWQRRDDRAWEAGKTARRTNDPVLKARQLAPFDVGLNLFVYAAGKRDLRNRISSPYIAPATGTPLQTIQVARLRYPGNWDPEPGAWRRYANWFRQNTGYALDVKEIKLRDLKPEDAPFAQLTGTARYDFTPDEVAAVKSYVEAGGVLLIDLCGGTGPFDQSARALVSAALPTAPAVALPSHHPLLRSGAPGMDDLPRIRLRPYAIEKMGERFGVPTLVTAGKGHVLLTNLDVTCALLDTNTWGILGYEPAYAESLIKNTLFWTVDGQPDK